MRVLHYTQYVFWGPAGLGVIIVECLFFASLGVSRWLRASERFLVVLRERREDFLIPTASFESSGLDFWWGDVATGVRDVRRGGGD